VVGGILYEKTGYNGVFSVGIALIAVDLVLRLLVIEKKTALLYKVEDTNVPNAFDSQSNGHSTERTPLLNGGLDGTIEDDTSSDADSQVSELASYIIPPNQNALIRQAPILACLRSPRLLTALLVGFMQATLLGSFDATVPTVALEYYNFTSLRAGLLFLALGIPSLLLGPVAGWTVDRFGTKPATVIGFSYLTPVLASLYFVKPGGLPEIRMFCFLLTLCGIGVAIIDAPSIVEAGLVVEKYHNANPDFFGPNGPYAQLYGINSMVFSAGFTLGPLVSGALKDSIGYGNMNLILAAMAGFTAILSIMFIGARPAFLRC
jgi:predicted MFS family arabinose efflux permease